MRLLRKKANYAAVVKMVMDGLIDAGLSTYAVYNQN